MNAHVPAFVAMFDEEGDFLLLVGEGVDQQTLLDLLQLAAEEIEDGDSRQTPSTSQIQ